MTHSKPAKVADRGERPPFSRATATADARQVRTNQRFHQELWSRLSGVDFIDSSMVFGALGILCLFPFMITISAAAGGNFADAVADRTGLTKQAAGYVAALFPHGQAPLATLTVSAFLVLGFVGMGAALQQWYKKVFARPPRGWRSVVYGNLIWSGTLLAYLAAQLGLSQVTGVTGSKPLIVAVQFALAVVFWWWTPWVRLVGAVPRQTLFPAGLATAVCYAGLGAFAVLTFSSGIVANYHATATSARS